MQPRPVLERKSVTIQGELPVTYRERVKELARESGANNLKEFVGTILTDYLDGKLTYQTRERKKTDRMDSVREYVEHLVDQKLENVLAK